MLAVPNQVGMAYESLVKDFEDHCLEAGCGYVSSGSKPVYSRFSSADRGEAKFECYLYLKDWKYRDGSQKRIDIVIRVRELIRCMEGARLLLRSSVHVSYFKVENQTASLIQNIHFDYSPNQAHPIFHAQVNNEATHPPADEAEDLEIAFHVENFLGQAWFNHARIPTSDMTFPSVLLCLASDHFGVTIFKKFKDRVCELQAKMPHPAFDALRASLDRERDHFRSSHWFSHLP